MTGGGFEPTHTFRWKDATAEHGVTLTLSQARDLWMDLGAFIRECAVKRPPVIAPARDATRITTEGNYILDASESDHPMCERQVGAPDIRISPGRTEEFEKLFREWVDRYPNREALESGGYGDVEALANQVLGWVWRARAPKAP